MYKEIRQEGMPSVTLDTGRLFGHNVPAREYDRQASLTHLEAMGRMGYNASLLTVDEFRYGMDFLKEALAKAEFTFVSCNLAWRKDGTLLAKPYTIIDAEGLKVGVIGVSADQDYSVFLKTPEGKPKQDDNVLDVLQEVKVLDPFESAGKVLRELDGKASPIIVLSSLRDEDNFELAKRYPQINLILTDVSLDDVTRKQYEQLPQDKRGPWPMYLRQGDTYLVQGSRTVLGQMIGRLDVTFAQGKVTTLMPLWLQLKEDTADDPEIRGILAKFYARVAKDENLQTPGKPIFGSNKVDSDPKNAYVGSSKCEQCHATQYEQWRASKHSDAFRSLVRQVPQRYYAPDCVMCHTVGFGRPTGFTIAQMQTDLRGVGCEVCHGPGKKHMEKPTKQNIRRTLTKQQCAECHTPEQMKGKEKTFDELYPDYLKQIKH